MVFRNVTSYISVDDAENVTFLMSFNTKKISSQN